MNWGSPELKILTGQVLLETSSGNLGQKFCISLTNIKNWCLMAGELTSWAQTLFQNNLMGKC